MRFCVDSSVLGTEKHLIVDDGFTWSESKPKNTWHLSGRIKPLDDWCLDTLMKLEQFQLDLFPPEKFSRVMKSLNVTETIPWQKVMPHDAHRSFTKNIVESVSRFINTADMNYYMSAWVPGNVALRSLQPAKINSKLWAEIMSLNVGNKHIVATFKPGEDDFARTPLYDRFGALTGRLTIDDGPNILTLKREYRSLLSSSYPGGSIFMLDFAGLEVRILLYESGKRCDDPDVYKMIANDLGGLDRNSVKAAVICELYGSSKQSLGKKLGLEGKKLDELFNKIHAYFNTDDLLSRIKKQFVETGCLKNRYGRKIVVDEPLDHVMINYYAQSTGVDVSMLGFSTIINDLKNTSVVPIYLLHDAMFLDVPASAIEQVKNIKTVKVKGYVQQFFIKATTLDCTQQTSVVD